MSTRITGTQCPAGSVPYIVRERDTLGKIAFFYSTTVHDIVRANPGINPNVLQVGQQICVPMKVQMYPSCPTTNYYVVQKGDTMDSIASIFNITPQQLLYSNYGIKPEALYPEQLLCIPVAPSPASIEVNISKRALTLYRNGEVYKSYRIGLENPAAPLPRGTFQIINKQVDPDAEQGARWLGLSEAGFGIQGANNPQFIETVSEGRSIILSNQDISELFNLVPVGTRVTVI